jgi:hypothetical protein
MTAGRFSGGGLTDRGLNARLRAAGPTQAAKYTPERAAREHLALYEELLSGRFARRTRIH